MDQDKVLPVITIKEKGTLEIENFPLEQPHGMRRLTGLTDELAQMPYSEDFVDVTVTDNEVMPDARVTLSTNFPNMIGFSVANDKMKDSLDVDGGSSSLHAVTRRCSGLSIVIRTTSIHRNRRWKL